MKAKIMSARKERDSADKSVKYKDQYTKKKLHGFLNDLLRVGSLKVRFSIDKCVPTIELRFPAWSSSPLGKYQGAFHVNCTPKLRHKV